MDIKFAGENLLRASGQAYTIVRPGQLVDGDLGWGTPAVGQCNGSFMRGAKRLCVCVCVCLYVRACVLCVGVYNVHATQHEDKCTLNGCIRALGKRFGASMPQMTAG